MGLGGPSAGPHEFDMRKIPATDEDRTRNFQLLRDQSSCCIGSSFTEAVCVLSLICIIFKFVPMLRFSYNVYSYVLFSHSKMIV